MISMTLAVTYPASGVFTGQVELGYDEQETSYRVSLGAVVGVPINCEHAVSSGQVRIHSGLSGSISRGVR